MRRRRSVLSRLTHDGLRRAAVVFGVALSLVLPVPGVAHAATAVKIMIVGDWFGTKHAACGEEPWINDYVFSYRESSFHPSESGNLAYAFALNEQRAQLNESGATRFPL